MSFDAGARCPACSARAFQPTDRALRYPDGSRRSFAFACASCGLLLGPDIQAAGHALGALGAGSFASPPDAPFGLDLYTLRSAALARDLRALPADGAQARTLVEPHSELAAKARLLPFAAQTPHPVSLGILCKASEVEAVLAGLHLQTAATSSIIILADGEAAEPRSVAVDGFAENTVRLAFRPLAGDFAAQRNALQDLSVETWMLQLDSDETLAPGCAARLPLLAGLAEADGLLSVGLTRRNLVDGIASDVFPDVQYRLNRRDIRYAGLVHERPERPWAKSLLVPGDGIEHHLTRERVLTRSRTYEAMAPGHGRPEEEDELLKPYRD